MGSATPPISILDSYLSLVGTKRDDRIAATEHGDCGIG